MAITILEENGEEFLHLVENAEPVRWSGFAFVVAAAIGGWYSEVGWHIWAALACTAAGIVLILNASRYEIRADSRHKVLRLERRSLLAAQVVSVPYSGITSVEFVTNTNRNSDGSSTYLIRVCRTGDDPIQASASVSWGRKAKHDASEKLARVIHVPFVELAID